MKRIGWVCVFLLALVYTSLSFSAAIDVHQFESPEQEQRYRQFIDDLRCPKCQNQNLSGSNSPIAQDLRRELYRMIQEGQNDQAITGFMVERYGNFVLYEPPMDKNTLLLWSLPALLLLALFMVLFLRSKQATKFADLSQQENSIGTNTCRLQVER